MMQQTIPYDYALPEERIAKFPLERRELSKLLTYRAGVIGEVPFYTLAEQLVPGTMLVFNNTKVIRARLIFHKESGARIEIFCLEPHAPADYERAFAIKGKSQWCCMVGNLKKWKEEELHIDFEWEGKPVRLNARRVSDPDHVQVNTEQLIDFSWEMDLSFGQLLEVLGRIPIPPYLHRESEESDNSRYQTVYSKWEGSVAAPTAGLHFTPEIIAQLQTAAHPTAEVTLHVGAGTFLPMKSGALEHKMHTEPFEISVVELDRMLLHIDNITAVGTTSVRTIESLCALGYRIIAQGGPAFDRTVGQWELYDIPTQYGGRELFDVLSDYLHRSGMERFKAATQIMIKPGFSFRVIRHLVTNFHQPQSTLLLLVAALVGDDWQRIYDYALAHDFRFLSYGDSSLLTANSDSIWHPTK